MKHSEIKERLKDLLKSGNKVNVNGVELTKIISQLLKEAQVMREALEFYAKMESFCLHDDPMLCDNCPDGGVFARKALRNCENIQEEVWV